MMQSLLEKTEPSPDPCDNAAWEGVTVISGGLENPTRESVFKHWESQGMLHEDAVELITQVEPDTLYSISTLFDIWKPVRKYAFTHRAVEDANRTRD